MLAELDSTAGLPVSKTKSVDATFLKNLFSNTGSPFVRTELNAATDKNLKDRAAVSLNTATERARLESWMDSLAKVSLSYAQTAAQGQDGIITASNGTSKYLISGRGVEYRQMVQKGIYAAVFFDQIANISLGTEKQSLPNDAVVSGKNYTGLEHSWDEAYGFLTKNATYPQPSGPTAERNFGRYLRQGPDSTNLFLAFLKGRAATVNNDREVMDAQITIIRQAAEKLLALEAVSYLNKTKSALGADNLGSAIHGFNEGFAFIYGLRFAHNPKINAAKSDELMNTLMGSANGFYDLTTDKINEVRNFIADAFGLDREAK